MPDASPRETLQATLSGASAGTIRRIRAWVDLEDSSLRTAMENAAPFARGRLLDVGCGDKPYEKLLAPHVTSYLGAEYRDTFESSANAAKGRADVIYTGKTLPFGEGEFDTVLCNQVAEHVPEPGAFIEDLVRVLKVGGCLILTVPFAFRIHAAPNDFHRFTRHALEYYANKNHLHVERLDSRGGFWSVVGQKLCSKIALRGARLGEAIQENAALGYERAISQQPRYWAIPAAAATIVAVSTAARLLEAVDPDDSDTLGYVMVARKRA